MRGEVLSYDQAAGAGLISGDDGVRYRFDRTGLMRPEPPLPGDQIDFMIEGEVATAIVVLGTTVRAAGRPPQLDPWAYFVRCMTRFYFQGEGRARRSEYWWFQLFHWIAFFAVSLILVLLGGFVASALEAGGGEEGAYTIIGLLWILAFLAFIIPSLTVLVRRLHDMGQSGFWVLISIVPLGGFALFIMTLMPSDPGPNRYGAYPL